jgi:hypothetical protein
MNEKINPYICRPVFIWKVKYLLFPYLGWGEVGERHESLPHLERYCRPESMSCIPPHAQWQHPREMTNLDSIPPTHLVVRQSMAKQNRLMRFAYPVRPTQINPEKVSPMSAS